MNTNFITKSILELMGTHEDGGYNFHIKDKKIPILLGKDKTTVYPEIRVTPFIEKNLLQHQKYIEDTYVMKKNTNDIVKLENGFNKIKCHKCGASIDVTKGVCEYCHSSSKYFQEWFLDL